MAANSLRTITLNSERLEGAINVLSRAAMDFGLTRSQRIIYRLLMVSVDVTIVSMGYVFAVLVSLLVVGGGSPRLLESDTWSFILAFGAFALLASTVVGMVSLLLNLPLFLQTLRDRAHLRRIGAKSLSKLLWKASRRHHWLSRFRSALLIVFGALGTLMAVVLFFETGISRREETPLVVAFYGSLALMMFGARHLRNQREQMDLAANADKLKEALQSVRQQAGATGAIAVPAELFERAASIESACVAKERKEAVLQSIGSDRRGYAIAFSDDAAQQRAALDMTDRLELEDLLARLSTGAAQIESPTSAGGAAARSRTESGRVEAEYVIGESRDIRITAVNRPASAAWIASKGASDA